MNTLRRLGTLLVSLIVAIASVTAVDAFLPKDNVQRISIHHENIEKGLTPSGTRFDYNELTSTDVLDYLSQETGIPYSEQWRRFIEVEPVLPATVLNTIETKRMAGEDYTYFPNEFRVRFKIDQSTVSTDEFQALSANYSKAYHNFFIDRYQYPFVDLEQAINAFQYSNYDYPELTDVFDRKYESLLSYLAVLIQEDSDFVSSEGVTFSDLRDTILLTKDLDLNQIDALVTGNTLTKDPGQLIAKYQYMIEQLELSKNKRNDETQTSEELLSLLEQNKSTVVLLGAGAENISISKVDGVYDTIASKTTDAKLAASTIEEDIRYFQTEIAKLQSQLATTSAKQAAKDEVEQLLVQTDAKINNWVQLIEKTSAEYFETKYKSAITVAGEPAEVGGLGTLSKLLLVALVFALIQGLQVLLYSNTRKQDQPLYKRTPAL